MNFNIIPITEAHIEGFRAVVDSVAREHKYLFFLEAPAIETTREFVLENIKENWPHFVAIADNKIIGWCDITKIDRLRPVFSHVGSLGMGIMGPYRGQGIGKALIHKAIEQARKKGLKRLELTVLEDNISAIALYKKVGFVQEGFHQKAVFIDGKYQNYFSMALFLN